MPGIKARGANLLVNSAPRWRRSAHRALATLAPSRRRLEFYWSAACPYSYVMAQQLHRLTQTSNLAVDIFPLPEGAGEFHPEPELRKHHGPRDCAELARVYDVDFPSAYQLPSEEQLALANQVATQGDAPALTLPRCIELGEALWCANDDALSKAASKYGKAEDALAQEQLRANAERQRKRGHYQSGSIWYLGEWLEGPMRVELLAERLAADGYATFAPWSRRELPSIASPGGSAPVEMWFSFRSPYSYIALVELQKWRDAGEEFEIVFRPVLPMVMRGNPVPTAKKLYLVTDAAREAGRQGIAFGLIADPVGEGAERCLAVCAALLEADGNTRRAFDFAVAASAGIWSQGVDVATDAGLIKLAALAKISEDEVVAAIKSLDAGRALAESNRALLFEAGVWGVPSFRCGEFVTWGQDRLELLRNQLGLATSGPASSGPVSS